VRALDYAKSRHAKIIGIVGRDGGYTARVADTCAIIPTVNSEHITPHSEAFQAIVWHLLVSHPALKAANTRWESLPANGGRQRAVFLDRDGVLTRAIMRDGKPFPPAASPDLQLAPDAKEALAQLKTEGFLLLVVTNQPDVARGLQRAEVVEEMHRSLKSQLPLDDIFVCWHDDTDQCDCRKPLPGLLLRATQRYDVDTGSSYMIGDRWRDVDAGAKAGVKTIWIDRGYAERQPSSKPSARVGSLLEAVDWILKDSLSSAYDANRRLKGQAVC
jgi:D-glycero-D-manno-heptose 1,7-bisphosphate phosphatase